MPYILFNCLPNIRKLVVVRPSSAKKGNINNSLINELIIQQLLVTHSRYKLIRRMP